MKVILSFFILISGMGLNFQASGISTDSIVRIYYKANSKKIYSETKYTNGLREYEMVYFLNGKVARHIEYIKGNISDSFVFDKHQRLKYQCVRNCVSALKFGRNELKDSIVMLFIKPENFYSGLNMKKGSWLILFWDTKVVV